MSLSTSTPVLAASEPSTRVQPLLDPWVWRMAWRDSRRSRGRLLVFSTALTLGVAALVAIGSLGWNLQRAIHEQARTLVGADLIVESRDEPPDAGAEDFVASLGGDRPRRRNAPRVDVHVPEDRRVAADPGARHRGGLPVLRQDRDRPARRPRRQFAAGKGALVEESLLLQYGEKPGDQIRIGGADASHPRAR